MDAVRPSERDISRQAGTDRRRIKSETKPEKIVEEEFSEILSRFNAKLVRLHPDFECESKHVVSVETDCSDRIVGASKLSLRGEKFSRDIHYNRGEIVGVGIFSIVMMTELTEIAFESLGMHARPLKTLFDFETPTSYLGARNVYQAIGDSGLTIDAVTFKDRIKALEGTTFAIRIIGYKTKDVDFLKLHKKDPKTALDLIRLRSDLRVDITYVAKVVKRSPDGVIHLLWREIGRKPAPALRFQGHEIPKDFRREGGD